MRSVEARTAAPIRRVAPHRRTAPARAGRNLRHVRHVTGASRARRPAIAVEALPVGQAFAESSFEMRTMPVYVMRPTSCDTQPPATLQSLPPAGFKLAAQKLLDELAGPTSRLARAPGPPADTNEGFAPGGLPDGAVGQPGLVGSPGGEGPTGVQPPPLAPPEILLPPISPPEGPPLIIGPEGPTPVGPPEGSQPPPGPPVIVSPPLPPPVTAGIPEPATWTMMILGFLAVGGALRARRRAANRAQGDCR